MLIFKKTFFGMISALAIGGMLTFGFIGCGDEPTDTIIRIDTGSEDGSGGGSTVPDSIPVTGIVIDPNDKAINICIGAERTIAVLVEPAEANQKVTWESSNVAVASVDTNGVVTGIKQGTAAIIVTTADGKFKDTSEVTVYIEVESVTLVPSPDALMSGQWTTVTASVRPADALQEVTWSSSDTTIAKVEGGALSATVYARAAGTATITATSAADPAKSDSYEISVEGWTSPHEFVVNTADLWIQAIDGIRYSGGSGVNYTIRLTRGIKLYTLRADTLGSVTGDLLITGNHTISLEDAGTQTGTDDGSAPSALIGSLLRIGADQNVILRDTDIDAGGANGGNPLVRVSGASNFTMQGTASLAGSGGVGVHIAAAAAAFTMDNNSSLSGNSNRGVYIDGGVFNMRGSSELYGNEVTGSGAGVFVTSGGRFTMSQGAIVHNNAVSGAYNDGGGVFVIGSGSEFVMEGDATLNNNSTGGNSGNGGGVAVRNGATFTMRDAARVHHNTTASYGHGGGVYVGRYATFTVEENSSVRIGNNTSGAFGDGGGVAVEGDFVMRSGLISNNKATDNASYGGGVSVRHDGTFNMSGGEIRGYVARDGNIVAGNTARMGGGVFVYGTFNMTGGVIYGIRPTEPDITDPDSVGNYNPFDETKWDEIGNYAWDNTVTPPRALGNGAAIYVASGGTATYGSGGVNFPVNVIDDGIQIIGGVPLQYGYWDSIVLDPDTVMWVWSWGADPVYTIVP